jgi:hypothetical protein
MTSEPNYILDGITPTRSNKHVYRSQQNEEENISILVCELNREFKYA